MKIRPDVLGLLCGGMVAASVFSDVLISEDFESRTIGTVPTGTGYVRPTTNTFNQLVEVVGEVNNPAGAGHGVRFLDNNPAESVIFLEQIAATVSEQVSAVRIDLALAPFQVGPKSGGISISVGEFDAGMASSNERFINCKVFADGTIQFDSDIVSLLASNNTLTMFINDYDAQTVSYTGPDDQSYALPPNSVAYWLNGSLHTFGSVQYTSLDLNDPTQGGTIGTTENNLGRFGFYSYSSEVGMDYIFDDIRVTTNLDEGSAFPAGTSWLVYEGTNGLVYEGYANEGQSNPVNTVPDFSKAGYRGGGVPIPFVPAAVVLSPGSGDDTVMIQNAIDAVSALPVGTNGFRGAVLLTAGDYLVSDTLEIDTSGVVIRGEGSQENGGTRITFTATTKTNLFEVATDNAYPREVSGTRQSITDAYVPVGATSFHVADGSGFVPGDRVFVQNMMNDKWINDLSKMGDWGWTYNEYRLRFRRTIVAVAGNLVTLDAPIVQAIEDQYGGGVIYQYEYNGELENIGFEALRLESTYASETDEDHGWTAIVLNQLNNGWVRQVTGRYFGFGLVNVKGHSQQITVEDCAMLDPKSTIDGGRRYSFNLFYAQNVLMQRCLTRGGRHDFVSGARTHGPNVFVDCRANEALSDIGPHERYSTGQLYDNIMGYQIDVQNRKDAGSGQGWAGAQIMFWNTDAGASITCQAPTGGMNWCVGSIGRKYPGIWAKDEPYGIWDSHNEPVQPRSLFYAQLRDRLGENALNQVIVPRQKTDGIWFDLDEWDGDGLFLDGLVTWADESAGLGACMPVPVRSTVRNLQLLENLSSVTWSKVSGPGTVTFADSAALNTTAEFSVPGSYVLSLTASADRGVPTYLVNDPFEGDTLGASPATAYEVSPSAPANDQFITVIGGSENLAGSGQAVRFFDDSSSGANRLGYRLASSPAQQVSGLAIEFSCALNGFSSQDAAVTVGVSQYDDNQASGSQRFFDVRLVADGTIDFRGVSSDDNNALLSSNNTVNIYVNDHNSESLTYVGPDKNIYSVAANSVDFWLNGIFEHSSLLQNRATAGGNVYNTSNNLGRVAFSTYTSFKGVDYIIDNVKIRELPRDKDVEPIKETSSLALNIETLSPQVAQWKLDDGNGTIVADTSGNHFDATLVNGNWVTGIDGGALEFNGVDSKVTLPAEAFATINNEISISMWVYGATTQPRSDALFYAADAAGHRVLNIHLPWNNSKVYWDAGYSDGYDRIAAPATADQFKDQWNHWVFVKDANAGTMEIYHNGILFHSGSGYTKPMAHIAQAVFGSQLNSMSYDGVMDDVTLYNVALSAGEIADLYGSYTVIHDVPVSWLISYGIAPTDAGALADTDGDGLLNWEEYAMGNDPLTADNTPEIRITEYYLTGMDFSGTHAVITLDQNLANDYYILVRGSREGSGLAEPDNNYARVCSVPGGKGDLAASASADQIELSRFAADFNWEGVVTVVECLNPASPSGFRLVDIAETTLTGTTGTDTVTPWSDRSHVVLFGGYRGGGAELLTNTTDRNQGSSVFVRLYPSGSDTMNWTRDAAGETLFDAVMTTFVVEWGSDWGIQRVNVTGNSGGDGADAMSEYTTASISGVNRTKTWLWATGTRNDAGIGDCAEACLVTLGDGVNQNLYENKVAVGSEYTDAYNFDVYVLSHPAASVEHVFMADANSAATDVPVPVSETVSGARFSWVYNGVNGTGTYHPREVFWSRYTGDSEITISRGFDGQSFPAWVQSVDLSGLNQ